MTSLETSKGLSDSGTSMYLGNFATLFRKITGQFTEIAIFLLKYAGFDRLPNHFQHKKPRQKSFNVKNEKSLKDISTGLKMPRGRKSLKVFSILKDIFLEDIRLPCKESRLVLYDCI